MHNKGIIPSQPFGNVFDDFFNKSISDIVGTDFTHESPAVNIIENDDSYEMEVASPGLTKEDFKVSIDKDHLIISAEKREEKTTENTDQEFKRREYNYQSFTRKFRLPNSVDKTSLTAKYKSGILKVSIQKTEEAKEKGPRSIEIG